jgi:peptidoglycan/LPS O-acetylase OafA/YrhL
VYLLALVLYASFILAHRFSVEPAAIAIKKSLASLLMSLFLIQSWGLPRFAIAWNGPGWSLSVEAALYPAFPWMTYRLAKLSHISPAERGAAHNRFGCCSARRRFLRRYCGGTDVQSILVGDFDRLISIFRGSVAARDTELFSARP